MPPRLRPLDLADVPSLLEDHVWRHLQLLERDGPPRRVTIEWVPTAPALPPF